MAVMFKLFAAVWSLVDDYKESERTPEECSFTTRNRSARRSHQCERSPGAHILRFLPFRGASFLLPRSLKTPKHAVSLSRWTEAVPPFSSTKLLRRKPEAAQSWKSPEVSMSFCADTTSRSFPSNFILRRGRTRTFKKKKSGRKLPPGWPCSMTGISSPLPPQTSSYI